MLANRMTAVAVFAALLSTQVAAQLPGDATTMPAPNSAQSAKHDAQAGNVGADLGTGWNILQIPAAAFTASRGDMSYQMDALGYVHAPFGFTSYFFTAPVTLPTGAGIGFLGLYVYDVDTSDVRASLYLLRGRGCVMVLGLCQLPVPPSATVLAFVQSVGAPGYQYVSVPFNPLHTVDNNPLQSGAQYVVWVTGEPLSPFSPIVFRGVDIWWKRQISPAPGSARFTDVPITAQFFAEIEALADSGITLGCTATTFCPDAPLTRRQMAAFLARALGLYWQY